MAADPTPAQAAAAMAELERIKAEQAAKTESGAPAFLAELHPLEFPDVGAPELSPAQVGDFIYSYLAQRLSSEGLPRDGGETETRPSSRSPRPADRNAGGLR